MSKTAAKPRGKGASSKESAPATGASSFDDALPGPEAIERMLAPVRAFMRDAPQARVRAFLDKLAAQPPQVLLLEGGTADDRLAAAHYWMLLLNCEPEDSAPRPSPNALPGLPGLPGLGLPGLGLPGLDEANDARPGPEAPVERPCLACPACARMISHLHRDCFFLDGTAGSIKIDDVRALRSVLGEPPREARRRVVVFREAQALVEAAANALLKSFEEPRPGTSFILLAPQRERLLPTLVSRSFCLTLPWPAEGDAAHDESLVPWEADLCTFLATGRNLFERTGARGAVDAALAHAVTNLCARALARCLLSRQGGAKPGEGLAALFARMPEARLRMADEALSECRDSLNYGVNPALVLEWLATRLYLLLPRTR